MLTTSQESDALIADLRFIDTTHPTYQPAKTSYTGHSHGQGHFLPIHVFTMPELTSDYCTIQFHVRMQHYFARDEQ